MGMSFWGGDINPAMVVVAKARLLSSHVTPSQASLCERIVADAKRMVGDTRTDQDPLRRWFTDDTAAVLRAIEHRIAVLFDPGTVEGNLLSAINRVSEFSALASFFYLALFRSTQHLLRPFRASNPTWVKSPEQSADKLGIDSETVLEQFRHSVTDMVSASQAIDLELPLDPAEVTRHERSAGTTSASRCPHPPAIEVASSTALPLSDHAAAAVVSSPPYCTRIDYAVTTAPELAILGMGKQYVRQLRDQMIGTSTIHRGGLHIDPTWGVTCAKFLKAIEDHPSKASRTYYLKNHKQYFHGIASSLREINRVLRPGAPCILVVQDSYYKECHNDLPTIVSEMGESLGWNCTARHDYTPSHHLGRINKKSRMYRSHMTAVESALIFTTAR